jgi:hypothetical protein
MALDSAICPVSFIVPALRFIGGSSCMGRSESCNAEARAAKSGSGKVLYASGMIPFAIRASRVPYCGRVSLIWRGNAVASH